MSDEIDRQFLDQKFITLINSMKDETLATLIEKMLINYKTELSLDEIESLSSEITNGLKSTSNVINVNHFIRQLKYLINKGIYGRITKKYRNDISELGIEANKVTLISDIQKKYYETIYTKNEESYNKEFKQIKEIDMFTEMPLFYTDYRLIEDDKKNENIKKAKLYMNIDIENTDKKEENYVLEISKEKLVGMYAQIEQLQEHLDHLY